MGRGICDIHNVQNTYMHYIADMLQLEWQLTNYGPSFAIRVTVASSEQHERMEESCPKGFFNHISYITRLSQKQD